MAGTTVEVRPLPIEKWHGKKNKESFAQDKVIEALYDENTGGYATGLTDEEVAKYEPLVGVKLDNLFKLEEPHPTWSSKAYQIRLQNATMLFDASKPKDFVLIKVMKASKFVANSMKEWEENKFPDATHVIFDETEQVELKASKVQVKREANAILYKMDLEDKIAMCRILSKKTVNSRSQSFIDVEIDAIVEEDPAEFIRTSKLGREEVRVRATVLELLAKNILTKEAGAIFYMGEQLAVSYEDAVNYFRDPNNTKMKVVILQKLENIK